MAVKADQLQAGEAAAAYAANALRRDGHLSPEAFEATLQDCDALPRFVLSHSPELVYLTDRSGRLRYVNRRFETLLGYHPDELIGQHYKVLVDDGFLDHAKQAFNERRTGRRAAAPVLVQLKSRLDSDGRRALHPRGLWVEVRAQGIYVDANERPPANYLGACGVAREIGERKEAAREMDFHAFHDVLTQLPNRALLNDRLRLAIAQARRSRRKLAVMFLDLNRFKRVNDHLGHSVGDRLLRAAVKRLQSCLRQGDTLSRFGGDEFTLLLPEVRNRAAAERVAAKILDRFEVPFIIAGRQIRIGASIGIALYPEAGERGDALVENADIAMYHAKGLGRNGFEIYADSMNRGVTKRLATVRELHRALKRREFEIHYQPQVCLASGQVRGFKALARWRHPTRGLLEPDDFVPLAEDAGLLGDIDAMVQQLAFTETARLRYGGAEDVHVSVSASSAQLEQEAFVEEFLARLGKARLEPGAVRLEVAEHHLAQSQDLFMARLFALKGHGVSIASDGFGAGHASLGYLQHSPIKWLHVDQSIIHDIRSDGGGPGIIHAIAALAKALGVVLLAQGVANRTQLRCLCAEGYREAQGPLFATPMPATDLARVLGKPGFAGLVDQARLPSGASLDAKTSP